MRSVGVILVLLVISQSFDISISIPEGVDKLQLSPRLLYRRKEGQLSTSLSPASLARKLFERLQLEHLKYKLNQAAILDSNELLFEMQTYLLALEVVRAWNEKIEENELSAESGRESKNCDLDCVNDDFELTQTERNFFKDPTFQYRQA